MPAASPVGLVAASGFVIAEASAESSLSVVVVSVLSVLSVLLVLSVLSVDVVVVLSLLVVPVLEFSSPVEACGGPAFATGAPVLGS